MLPRRISLVFAVLILILIPVWFFFFLPLATALPTNFSRSTNLTHTEDNRFTIGGNWSGHTISTGEMLDTVEKSEYRKAYVKSRFDVRSLVGEALFSLDQDFIIDRVTMRNLPGGNDVDGEAYFYFPRHIQNKNIRWWPGTFGEPLDLIFIETTKIKDLPVHHFRGERSDINDTAGYDFLPLVPQKYLVLSRAVVDVYVEPATGTVIDYRDEGVSYYTGLDKSPVWDLAKWSNKYTDIAIEDNIVSARELRNRLFLMEVVIPLTLLLVSLLLFNYAISKHKYGGKRKR